MSILNFYKMAKSIGWDVRVGAYNIIHITDNRDFVVGNDRNCYYNSIMCIICAYSL